jgi:hypothetical protein
MNSGVMQNCPRRELPGATYTTDPVAIASNPATADFILTAPHFCTTVPSRFEAYLVCTTTDLGYAVGDKVKLPFGQITAAGASVLGADVDNVFWIWNRPTAPIAINLVNKGTPGTFGAIDYTKWSVIFIVWT